MQINRIQQQPSFKARTTIMPCADYILRRKIEHKFTTHHDCLVHVQDILTNNGSDTISHILTEKLGGLLLKTADQTGDYFSTKHRVELPISDLSKLEEIAQSALKKIKDQISN